MTTQYFDKLIFDDRMRYDIAKNLRGLRDNVTNQSSPIHCEYRGLLWVQAITL